MIRIAHRSFRFYLVRAESCDRTRIVLPAKRRTFVIEHTMKGFRELPGLWRIWESWTGDPDCGMRAIQAGEARRKTGPEPVLAGVRAIQYAYETMDDRITQRVAFAPDLGCTAAALSSSERNDAGWPVSAFESKLTSVVLGEPDPRLFEVPADYHMEHSDQAWP